MKNGMAGLVAGLLLSGAAQAALVNRGDGMLYDDVLKVTWLQDANYAKTSGYSATGQMTWSEAKTWADNLVYGGYSDWRLASNSPVGADWNYNYATNGSTDLSFNITSSHSELSYMYYVNLGLHGFVNSKGVYDPTFGIYGNGTRGGWANVGLVDNLQSAVYWSGTADALYPEWAWHFITDGGYQHTSSQLSQYYAWAVRDGDVAAAAPEPATLALTFAALGLAGLARRRRSVS